MTFIKVQFPTFLTVYRHYVLLLFILLTPTVHAAEKLEVEISGVEDELLENVRAYLSLEQQKDHPQLSVARINRLHHQAPNEIKQALQPFGYYRANVVGELSPPTGETTHWKAHYTVESGQPLTLKTMNLRLEGEGEQDEDFKRVLAAFPLKQGDRLNQKHYEQGKRQLTALAEEKGYFDARFTRHEIQIDEQAYTAQIFLAFSTGKRYRFGNVVFEQNTFEESLLRRFLTFEVGNFYSNRGLIDFKNALTESDYFEEVQVEVQRALADPNAQVPITVHLTPRKASKYSFGIGYGTDTGARGSLGWERRRLNSKGHRIKAAAQLSEIYSSTEMHYYLPLGHDQHDYLDITGLYKDENINTHQGEIISLALNKFHARKLFERFTLREMIGLEYRDERYSIGSDTGHTKLLMPVVSWSHRVADDLLYTLRGHKVQLEVRGAIESLGSNNSFIQTQLSAALIRQFHEKGRIIARGEVGYSEISLVNGQFNELPPSIRFFAGGDRSVRGYDYESLGPKNAEGQVIGGRHLLIGSLEYEHRILEKWSLAAFVDVGNAFNGFSESLKQGVGIGVRWHSPVGPIRFDVATAISEEGHPIRLHITVGPDLY